MDGTHSHTLTGDAVTRPKSFIVKKIIRCWNSTASGMGAPIATETEYGLVKLEPPTPPVENRVQVKVLSANNKSPTTDWVEVSELNFNNLVIGNWYRISFVLLGQFNYSNTTASNNIRIQYISAGTPILNEQWNHNNAPTSDAYQQSLTGSIVFKANDNSIIFKHANSIDNACMLIGNGGVNRSFVQLEELNNYKETTDFT